MLHWRKILQVTGGDLAVHKCAVTLIKWKWSETSTIPSMMNSNEAPGTIILPDINGENASSLQLRRLEPTESERQLGIIMPLDGNFHQEKDVRWAQSKSLGQKMYRAPLSTYEGVLVYRMYYIPKIAYPLSLTRFTQKECDDIQSQFYRYALPKMGLNRHTPKSLLFGPPELRGFGLHDLYSDQITQHITKISQHIRRRDSVGRAFLSNIHVFEIIVGSAQPLFNLNYWNYSYVDKTTTIHFSMEVVQILEAQSRTVPT